MAHGSVERSAIRSGPVSLQAVGCQGLRQSPKTRPLTAHCLPLKNLVNQIGWPILIAFFFFEKEGSKMKQRLHAKPTQKRWRSEATTFAY